MIRSLIKLLVILVIGILIYNYFLGTESEKEGAKKIFGEMKDVGVAVKDLLKSEKEKFDKGKYDNAIDKIGNVLSGLKQNAKDFDEKYLNRIKELERKRAELKRALSAYDEKNELTGDNEFTPKGGTTKKDSTAIKKELEQLLKETEGLMKEMESSQ
jgi:basic membrane lipoprotein Med (substrate-binding protein (PBP1-ABC) superfamily)